MRALFHGLKSSSSSEYRTTLGRDPSTMQFRRSVRKSPRAVLGVEALDARELLSTTVPALVSSEVNLTASSAPTLISNSVPSPSPDYLVTPQGTLSATAVSSTQVNLAYSPWPYSAAALHGYAILETSGNTYEQIATTTGTSYSVTGLSPNTNYTFIWSPIDVPNVGSATASALTYPSAPTFTLTAASATQVNIAWGSVPGANSYVIDELINGAWKQIETTSSTSFPVSGLTPNAVYSFTVSAVNVDGGATWANSQSILLGHISIRPVPG